MLRISTENKKLIEQKTETSAQEEANLHMIISYLPYAILMGGMMMMILTMVQNEAKRQNNDDETDEYDYFDILKLP